VRLSWLLKQKANLLKTTKFQQILAEKAHDDEFDFLDDPFTYMTAPNSKTVSTTTPELEKDAQIPPKESKPQKTPIQTTKSASVPEATPSGDAELSASPQARKLLKEFNRLKKRMKSKSMPNL